ncbi:MAG: hypothetical protein ACNS60_05700 [Candidatus Cyclobacteriaceae bacterium M2_1C_046]
MKVLSTILSAIFFIPIISVAQNEHDDLYYTPKDRQEDRIEYKTQVLSSPIAADLREFKPAEDRISNTSQGRTVNPEYVAQYRSRADARQTDTGYDDEVYYDEYYDEQQVDNAASQTVINNYYGNTRVGGMNPYYDPFFANDWRYRNWRYRYAYDPFYDPFFDPYFGHTGWSMSFGYGWGRPFYGASFHYGYHDPFFNPYYRNYYGYGYNPYWGNPYWGSPYNSHFYGNNVVIVNNNTEVNNRHIRRGPAISRGSVVNRGENGRGSAYVNDRNPIRRTSVDRSSFNEDRNGRIRTPSSVSRGRVIQRSGVEARTPSSTDYDRSRFIDRNNTTRPSIDRSRRNIDRTTPAIDRSRRNIDRSTPSRNIDRNRNHRSRPNIDRSRNNHNRPTPSRGSGVKRGNNERSMPSRSSGVNRSSSSNRSSGYIQQSSGSRSGSGIRSGNSGSSMPRSSSPSRGSSSRGSRGGN